MRKATPAGRSPSKPDNAHTKARIDHIDGDKIHADLKAGKVVIVAGFQGITADGDISTLGRGGSDTSAVALAAALKADECQIYTDVDGVYTTDPRVVPEARRMSTIRLKKCWSWPVSARKSYKSVRWNSPENTKSACAS